MKINVEVTSPKRIAGIYIFSSFGEFYDWIDKNFKRPRILKAVALLSLAEGGSFEFSTGWYGIKASCDKVIGYKAKEIARKIGFLKSKRGGDIGYNLGKANEYVKILDENISV